MRADHSANLRRLHLANDGCLHRHVGLNTGGHANGRLLGERVAIQCEHVGDGLAGGKLAACRHLSGLRLGGRLQHFERRLGDDAFQRVGQRLGGKNRRRGDGHYSRWRTGHLLHDHFLLGAVGCCHGLRVQRRSVLTLQNDDCLGASAVLLGRLRNEDGLRLTLQNKKKVKIEVLNRSVSAQ